MFTGIKAGHIDFDEEGKVLFAEEIWEHPMQILEGMTFYHESIHYLQDLATGAGITYNHLLLEFIRAFKKLKLEIPTKFAPPLKSWALNVANKNHTAPLAFVEEVEKYSKYLDILYSNGEYSIDPDFKYISNLSASKRALEQKYLKIGTRELLEGAAFLLSKMLVESCAKMDNKFALDSIENFVNHNKINIIYSSALMMFETALFTNVDPTLLSESFIYRLFLIVCDYSLLTPPLSEELGQLLSSNRINRSCLSPISRFTAVCSKFHQIKELDFINDSSFHWANDWLDKISHQENWISTSDIINLWIRYLKYRKNKETTWFNCILTSQLLGMEIRKEEPYIMQHWFNMDVTLDKFGFQNTLKKLDIPIIFKTSTGIEWRYVPNNQPNSYEELMQKVKRLASTIFSISISWQVAEHLLYNIPLECPLYKFPCSCTERDRWGNPCEARKMIESYLGSSIENIFDISEQEKDYYSKGKII